MPDNDISICPFGGGYLAIVSLLDVALLAFLEAAMAGVAQAAKEEKIGIFSLLTRYTFGVRSKHRRGGMSPLQEGWSPKMKTVSKTEFEAFVAAKASRASIESPRVERDVEYSYECFDDEAGNEVAFITYPPQTIGLAITYHVKA